jgi:hypothetical protein
MANFGSLAVPDLVRSGFPNILEFGEQRLFEYIAELLEAYNAITRDEMLMFVVPTTERIMGYGGSPGVTFVKTNEYGRADASKPTPGGNIGLPLELNAASVQWTRKWFENHLPEDLTSVVEDTMLADTQQRQKDLKNAFFVSTNRTFIDKLVDGYSLSVKALANADGFALPPDPYGNTFNGSTHTHYIARVSTLAASDIDAVINTVAEHYNRGKIMLLINTAQDATIRGFNAAGQFISNQPVEFRLQTTTTYGNVGLDTSQINNRLIGYWGNQAAEVWVKPWVPANYMVAVMTNHGNKVLAMRERRSGGSALRMVADNENFPLRAQSFESEYGLGVVDRVGAAVLYIGGTSYVDITF